MWSSIKDGNDGKPHVTCDVIHKRKKVWSEDETGFKMASMLANWGVRVKVRLGVRFSVKVRVSVRVISFSYVSFNSFELV